MASTHTTGAKAIDSRSNEIGSAPFTVDSRPDMNMDRDKPCDARPYGPPGRPSTKAPRKKNA